MDPAVVLIFAFVYLGMILGGIPGLALDRTGVALLGAIALLALGRVSPSSAWQAVDVSTIGLLLGLMVVSAQFRLGGFYTCVTHRLAEAAVSPPTLLALLVAVTGLLSAVLANDIVCLAMAPVLVEGCTRRRLDPVPFLLGLACASNVGSAATLIGNPQNMLIGQKLGMSFAGYLLDAGVPSILGLVVVWAVTCALYRGRWERSLPQVHVEAPAFDGWQSAKALAVVAAIMGVFLFTPWPRDVVALAAAGVLLTSRKMASRHMLSLVDWQLLVLFDGLFIINHAVAASGILAQCAEAARHRGIDVGQPAWMFVIVAVLSNLVSNVPAVMLLLPMAEHPAAGAVLALSSTLAGNLFIVGSIANVIVVDQASRQGVRITWRQHARVGVPVTVLTLAIAGCWLWIRASIS